MPDKSSMCTAGSPQATARSLAASSASLMRSASSAALTASAAAVGAPVVLVRSAANLVLEPKQALAAALSWAYWQPIPLQVRRPSKAIPASQNAISRKHLPVSAAAEAALLYVEQSRILQQVFDLLASHYKPIHTISACKHICMYFLNAAVHVGKCPSSLT